MKLLQELTGMLAEGLGKNVVKSVKVGNFRHDLVDTGMGWQVRIYNGDQLYDTGLSKNSEEKGLDALKDAVAYTEKLTHQKRQGVAEGKVSGYKMYQNHDGTWYVEDENENVVLRNASKGEAEHAVRSGNKKLEQGIAEAGPFSYGKPPRKGSVAAQADQKRKKQDRETPAIEPKDQRVGVAKVTKDAKEGSDNTVHFEIDSENAYNRVMKKFGSMIDWDDGAMVISRKYWEKVQQLAQDAGGRAEEVGGEQHYK